MQRTALLTPILASTALPSLADDAGQKFEAMLAADLLALFGVESPLGASAPESAETGFRKPDDTAAQLVSLAGGLQARFLTREAADSWDMMTPFPAENPTHLIACIEGDLEEIAPGKLNPGIQRLSLTDGKVETILRGTSACDGIRTTPWGTIVFTEEDDNGRLYELFDPLNASGLVITDREAGTTSDPAMVITRTALPVMAWEGIGILPDGTIYAGDELRPGTDAANADGGAIFKFVPAAAHTGGAITSLDQSPLAAGKTYAMQVSCRPDEIQVGQGCETGAAAWIEIDPALARTDADAKAATGYYRPEDLHIDPAHAGEGVRFCVANTGNEGAQNNAEVICVIDRSPATIAMRDAEGKIDFTTEVARFIEGDEDFNSFDNLDFQPGTGNLFVIEDHTNGDIFACLRDGADRDVKSDGCIRVLSVADSSAEPTGFIFSEDGTKAWLSIQHSNDDAMAKVDDYGTDDILEISGFVLPTN